MPKTKLKKNSPKSPKAISALTFFLIGILLILFSVYWNFYESASLSFNNFQTPQVNSIVAFHKKAVKLIIPGKSINLDIEEASISNGNWQTSPTGASHLITSANPGQKGNIIIYGHNKKKIMGNIRSMKINDSVTLVDEKGINHNYQVIQTLTVNPSDVWVLDNTIEETLTLYTCSGLFDSKRFIVKAKPVS